MTGSPTTGVLVTLHETVHVELERLVPLCTIDESPPALPTGPWRDPSLAEVL